MLRSILVALDDTPGAQAARDVAIALARATDAALTFAVVLDRPHTAHEHEAVPLGGHAFKARRDARLVEQAEQEAELAIAAAVAAAGETAHAILRLDDAPGATLPAEGPVLAAYDGSAPAREAFHLFALLGLAGGQPVRVAAVGAGREDALASAEDGMAILGPRGIAAEPLPLTGRDVSEAVLAAVESSGARMLVMGAFGGSSLIRLLVGSTTDVLLRDCPVPVFVAR